MDTLRVRAYNVYFGDAILITVPDRGPNGKVTQRHILIDVGNYSPPDQSIPNEDSVFKPIVEDVVSELDDKPLDLYVMTHEHMDHVQGLLYAAKNFYGGDVNTLKGKLKTRHAWLTASAEENYYTNHPPAREKHLQVQEAYKSIVSYFRTFTGIRSPFIDSILEINSPRKTKDCVDYLRRLAPKAGTSYVHRGTSTKGIHGFNEARFEIWAPEEDTSTYYAKLLPMAIDLNQQTGAARKFGPRPLVPPAGVDAGSFYDLVESRRGIADNLLAIDKAENNTSVVFCLEWRGWRLLFAGDAEELSWKQMSQQNAITPVHFLKVSHHGSHNGTPDAELLDQLMPAVRPDNRSRHALVSTCENVYGGVPDTMTLDMIRQRCDQLCETQKLVAPGQYVDVTFQG